MNFKEFNDKLYIKEAFKPKDQFTRNLFLNAVNDTSKINDKYTSLEVFKGYSQGNSIKEIAFDIVDYLDTEKLSDYINSLFDKNPTKKAEYKETVCNKFKSDLENINLENMADILAELFTTIIKEAAIQSKRNQGKIPPESNSQSHEINTSEGIAISDNNVNLEKALNSMKEIANHIIMIFNKIRFDSTELLLNMKSNKSCGDDEKFEKFISAIDGDYLLFTELNIKLMQYMDQYPKLNELVSVIKCYLTIEKTDFYKRISTNDNAYEFVSTISKYKKAIGKLKSYIDSELDKWNITF